VARLPVLVVLAVVEMEALPIRLEVTEPLTPGVVGVVAVKTVLVMETAAQGAPVS